MKCNAPWPVIRVGSIPAPFSVAKGLAIWEVNIILPSTKNQKKSNHRHVNVFFAWLHPTQFYSQKFLK